MDFSRKSGDPVLLVLEVANISMITDLMEKQHCYLIDFQGLIQKYH